MKKLHVILSVITVLTFCYSLSFGQMKMSDTKNINTTKSIQLKTDMRKLWEDHVTWTRNVILCLTDNLPGTDQAVKRLLQNQTDIGNAVALFYGTDAGNKLTELLNAHINIAAEVVLAAKAGNNDKLKDANARWFVNADEISEFLSTANPNWALTDLKSMMHTHLQLTTDEAVNRLKKDYESDVNSYDALHKEILEMSDMLTYGIIKQFPKKFK